MSLQCQCNVLRLSFGKRFFTYVYIRIFTCLSSWRALFKTWSPNLALTLQHRFLDRRLTRFVKELFKWTYIPAYIPAYMHTCIHKCIHSYMHTYVHTCICTYNSVKCISLRLATNTYTTSLYLKLAKPFTTCDDEWTTSMLFVLLIKP